MRFVLQKNLKLSENIFSGVRQGVYGRKKPGRACARPGFSGTLVPEQEEVYFCEFRLRRLRAAAAMPVRPVPSRTIVAGSGTVVCCAPVIPAVNSAVLPDWTWTSSIDRVNEPVVPPLLKVKTWVGLA